jgi:hypothetical protein
VKQSGKEIEAKCREIWVGNLQKVYHFEDLGIDWKILLKWMLTK